MSADNTLIAALQQRAQNTPYLITATDTGFRLELNIADASYYTLMYKVGVKRAFRIEAKVNNGNKTVQTTDILTKIDWQAGDTPGQFTPRVSWRGSITRGEIYEFGTRKDLGVSNEGAPGVTVNYTYSTTEAKQWLSTQLKELGWKRTMGLEAKIGLVMGLVAIAGLIIGAFVVLGLLIFNPEYFQG